MTTRMGGRVTATSAAEAATATISSRGESDAVLRENAANPSKAFADSMAFVLQHEGGLSTDQDDRGNRGGGHTFKGITSASLSGNPELAGRAPRSLTDREIEAHYRREYWKKSGADALASAGMEDLAAVTFDTAVNMGVYRSKLILLKAAGVISEDTNISRKITPELVRLADAQFPEALRRLATYSNEGLEHIAQRCCDIREEMYRRFAQNGNQAKFLNGWMNRLNDLRAFVEVEDSGVQLAVAHAPPSRPARPSAEPRTHETREVRPEREQVAARERRSSVSQPAERESSVEAESTDKKSSVFSRIWNGLKSVYYGWEHAAGVDKREPRFKDSDSLEPVRAQTTAATGEVQKPEPTTAREAAAPPPPLSYELPDFMRVKRRVVLPDGTETVEDF